MPGVHGIRVTARFPLGRVTLVESRHGALCSVQGGGGRCALLRYTRLTTTYGGPPATAPGPLPPLMVTRAALAARPNPNRHNSRQLWPMIVCLATCTRDPIIYKSMFVVLDRLKNLSTVGLSGQDGTADQEVWGGIGRDSQAEPESGGRIMIMVEIVNTNDSSLSLSLVP